MNLQKFSAIGHRDHDYCNPMSAGKIERLLDLLPLQQNTRVLDLGCGRGELALRIIERFGASVVAVERSPYMLDAARERHAAGIHELPRDAFKMSRGEPCIPTYFLDETGHIAPNPYDRS